MTKWLSSTVELERNGFGKSTTRNGNGTEWRWMIYMYCAVNPRIARTTEEETRRDETVPRPDSTRCFASSSSGADSL